MFNTLKKFSHESNHTVCSKNYIFSNQNKYFSPTARYLIKYYMNILRNSQTGVTVIYKKIGISLNIIQETVLFSRFLLTLKAYKQHICTSLRGPVFSQNTAAFPKNTEPHDWSTTEPSWFDLKQKRNLLKCHITSSLFYSISLFSGDLARCSLEAHQRHVNVGPLEFFKK